MSDLPHVVIVGGGFGGLDAAHALSRAPVSVTLVDRHNYHLFQPLLYQVTTAALSPADIASPIRGIVRHSQNVNVILAKVSGIDLDRREVIAEGHHVRDSGSLATIGRKRAVAQIGEIKLDGFIAWLLWSLAHIYFLIGFRNRIVVAMSWAWSYVTFQRGTRLITGLLGSRMEDMPMPVPMDPLQPNQARHAA